jgi:hypothetical protein
MTPDTILEKFENFQKKCIKWDLSDGELSYGDWYTSARKCKQMKILSFRLRFKVNDLIHFYKIVHELVPIRLPRYLTWFDGSSRLRSTYLDHLSLISTSQVGITVRPRINHSIIAPIAYGIQFP